MLSKKSKIFVLTGMVALLVLAGCLNIFLNQTSSSAQANSNDVVYGSFFQTYRADRQEQRNQTVQYLDAIINSADSTAEAIAEASQSKLALTKSMETELVLEGLIKSLGYEDAVVTSTTQNINVIVKAPSFGEEDAAKILSVVKSETGKKATNLVIIPVE